MEQGVVLMRCFLLLSLLLYGPDAQSMDDCPHLQEFLDNGWIVHKDADFERIVTEKLIQFVPEIGNDLMLDHQEFYMSDFSHNYYLKIWVVIWDRVSTEQDEMWGDIALAMTGPDSEEYVEIRWYDHKTKEKHIACNPDFVCCLSTKIPLAFNTIF